MSIFERIWRIAEVVIKGADKDAFSVCSWSHGAGPCFNNSSPCYLAVVKFASGYCRVYADTAFGPPDGRYLSFWSPWGWMYRFPTWETANMAMQRAVAHHRCHHWW
jgi:hypothetical protein